MKCSDKWVVQLVVDQCETHGIVNWVFSPGSRNAPFAITVDPHEGFQTTVIHDERSAAFFALGLAERTQQPVVLCCTSGSAPANYMPAITEAYYRNIPLLVVSADRPKAWTDQGDGQTIRQLDLFKDFTHGRLHLEDENLTKERCWYYQRESAVLFSKLCSGGPVHINVGLAEPLYGTSEKTRSFGRRIQFIKNNNCHPQEIADLAKLMRRKKIMVLCGQMPPNKILLHELSLFSQYSNVVVMTENTSNLPSENFNPCIDRSLNSISEDNRSTYEPEVLITLGGAIVSKRIKAFLRSVNLSCHIKVGVDFPEMDTYQQLTHSFECEPSSFFSMLNSTIQDVSDLNFKGIWKKLDYLAKDKISQFQVGNILTDFSIYKTLFEFIPEGAVLHMANSSVIRYCQLFDPIPNCAYYSNRGTSGIDGSTSTALGFSSQDDRLNLLITGDVSFLYDSNALQRKDLANNLKIVIINNQGGGIFRIIEGAKDSTQLSTYFEASHSRTGEVSKTFGWKYRLCTALEELPELIENLLYKDDIDVLEIITDPLQSPTTLKDFFTFVR